MNLNKRILLGIIIVITLLWGANTLHYNSKKIERPMFFRHLIETSLEYNIILNYIKPIDNNDSITYVKIPELSSEPIYVKDFIGVEDSDTVYKDKHYKYCLLNIELNHKFLTYNEKTDNYISKIKGDRVFTKITYGTSSGKEFTEDIGKVYIKDYKEKDKPKFVEETGSGGGSVVGEKFAESSATYATNKGVRFIGYNGVFKNEIEDLFDIKLDGKNIKKVKLPLDIDISIYIQTTGKKNIDSKKDIADFYSVNLDLYFENNKGEKEVLPFNVSGRSYIMNYGDVKKKEVDDLIKIRRGE